MSKRTTIQIPADLATRLDKLAALLERPREWVVEQALTSYIDESMDDAVKIAEALADIRSGTAILIPHEEVMHEMHELIRSRSSDADSLARRGTS